MTNSTNFIGKQELGNAVERVKIYRPTQLISTASGALVVGGVSDTYIPSIPGDSFPVK